MSTCVEARQECLKYEDYLTLDKPFDADPDIAGIGVIIAILISAWVSLAVVLVAYFQDDTWKSERLDRELIGIPSRLERVFSPNTKHQETGQAESKKPRPRVLKALVACVHAFSDQQLAVGLALLLTSYIQHCTITQYHFFVVYAASWISTTVHQCAAQVLRQQEKQVAPNTLRVGLILALWPLLAASLVVVWNERFLGVLGLSTQCIWDDSSRLTVRAWLSMFVEQAILAWGTIDTLGSYSMKVARVSNSLNVRVIRILSAPGKMLFRIRQFRGQPAQRMTILMPSWKDPKTQPNKPSKLQRPAVLLEAFLWVVFVLATLLLLLLESNLVNLLRIIGIMMMQTVTIASVKRLAASTGEMEGSENEMGFGQIMPLLLLVLPILSIVQSLEDSKDLDDPTPLSDSRSMHQSPRNSEPQLARSNTLPEPISTASSSSTSQIAIGSTSVQRMSVADDEMRMLVARVRTGTDLERRLALSDPRSHTRPETNVEVEEGYEHRGSPFQDVVKLQNVLCSRPWFLALVVTVVVVYFLYVGLAVQYDLPVA